MFYQFIALIWFFAAIIQFSTGGIIEGGIFVCAGYLALITAEQQKEWVDGIILPPRKLLPRV